MKPINMNVAPAMVVDVVWAIFAVRYLMLQFGGKKPDKIPPWWSYIIILYHMGSAECKHIMRKVYCFLMSYLQKYQQNPNLVEDT